MFVPGKGRWKPGQSGNPAGPGRIIRFTDRLLMLLAEEDTDPKFETKLDRLCAKAFEYACKGDAKFASLILERADPATRYRVSMNVSATATPDTILAHLRSLGAKCRTDAPALPMPAVIDVEAKEVPTHGTEANGHDST